MTEKRITKEELMKLVIDVTEIDIDGKKFGVRPITYAEDMEIERTMNKQMNDGERIRQRILMQVWKGLVDPKLTPEDIGCLPVGLVTKIAISIGEISSGVSKK